MIFAIVACVALILGYVYYKVKENTVPFKASAVAPSVTPPATVAVVQPSGAIPVSKSDPRSTAAIVAECDSLHASIKVLTAKQAAGDGSVGRELTAEHSQLSADLYTLADRHKAGDAAAVWKNPDAR